ncbi:MAG: RNA polymerase sigma factor [Thermomicrobiales bacterium]
MILGAIVVGPPGGIWRNAFNAGRPAGGARPGYVSADLMAKELAGRAFAKLPAWEDTNPDREPYGFLMEVARHEFPNVYRAWKRDMARQAMLDPLHDEEGTAIDILSTPGDGVSPFRNSPEEVVVMLAEVENLLSLIPDPVTREAVRLVVVGRVSIREAARRVGLESATLKKRLDRIFPKVAKQLAQSSSL